MDFQTVLEEQIDRHGVGPVIEELAAICLLKSEHLSTNRQDQTSAEWWNRLACRLNDISKELGDV